MHKASCLDKNNLKYSYASDQLKNTFLTYKNIIIKTSQKPSSIIDHLKANFELKDLELSDKTNTITFKAKLSSKAIFNKLKEELQNEEFVESVELF